ncbi:MAG: hypothetical protein HY717_07965 [Planctomycetes bacterium]|nr:hypothetical protein [Planctomycetota bacterium]
MNDRFPHGELRLFRGRPFRARPDALAALLLVLASGCGYTLGYRTPPQVLTIAVPIFHNATFPLRREVEFDLTSLVRQEIQKRTALAVVPEDEADLVLRGTIVDFREHLVVEGRNDAKIESNIDAVVDLVVEDYQNGVQMKRRVRTVEPFSLLAGETFNEGRRRALGNLAERIVAAVEYWDDYDS